MNSKETWSYIAPYLGAHIRCKAPNFYHHGIYISDTCVVHFGTRSFNIRDASSIKVAITTLAEFSEGELIEVKEYTKKEQKMLFSPDIIAKRALDSVGEDGYDFIHNNCEHFANYCTTNQKISYQALAFRKAFGSKKK